MNRPNILFLMVDCMRADLLWDRQRYPSMPNLDRLCAESRCSCLLGHRNDDGDHSVGGHDADWSAARRTRDPFTPGV